MVSGDDKYAYLSKTSLASIDGEYIKKDCRFVLEKEAGKKNVMYLHVYKGKKEWLYRFQVLEKYEEVEGLLDAHYHKLRF